MASWSTPKTLAGVPGSPLDTHARRRFEAKLDSGGLRCRYVQLTARGFRDAYAQAKRACRPGEVCAGVIEL